MTGHPTPAPEGPQYPPGEEPIARVPLLRLEGTVWDPVALETWHESLSGLLKSELPHDLLALWLFPASGQAVLLGPSALSQDHLTVPLPTPRLGQDQLYLLEEIIRDHGYRSAVAMAIPHGARDVGLLLMADLRPAQYGLAQAVAVREVADSLGPTMARVARQWGRAQSDDPEGEAVLSRRRFEPDRVLHELNQLLTALGHAEAGARTPRDLTQAVAQALQPLLPHDRVELLVADAGGQQHYRFGEHGHGPLWQDPVLVVGTEAYDPEALLGEADTVLVEDADTDAREPVWLASTAGADPEEQVRSMIGVRLQVQGRTIGYLLLGNFGPEFYQPEDRELLAQIGPLLAVRVDAFLLAWQAQVLRSHLGVLRNVPATLGRVGEVLATTAHIGAATRLFAREAATVLPFERMEFALRLGEDDQVALLQPGETRPLVELPTATTAGTELGRVLRGEISHALATDRRAADAAAAGGPRPNPTGALVVPLRVAGRVFGTMTLVASGMESFNRPDVVLAQQLADLMAPHLELLRRAVLSLPSPPQNWRRASRF